ncbi:TonB-dependent receptor [Sphingomonas sp. G-3-2-10]|uniref:TonB-dependent receptor plug domain-containing protein n=1 Tax=Sphingomonas sp. G-3-2-10 TaxID=2728838 RepID=UPI00146ED4CD|nr:TonB-dependent receptor [Sphingomonas sp. G-3-2-10]NML04343.1 TonB-dependent receptor [Sphingomonas sp. G-3-2-10]
MKPIRIAALCGTALLSLGWSVAAQAQDAPAAEEAITTDEPVTELVVTGSRLRGAAPVGSTVTTLGREDVEMSGAVSTDRLIQQLPQVFDLGVSENSRGQGGGSGNIAYGNTINLRGIGPYATLILVDGHRAVNNSRAFEPSVIPTLGLERVEVVADGASAIYGSDAIAGVVNLIPRRSLDGVEATARYGAGADFNESQFGLAIGKKWETGQVMLAYERVYRSNLNGDDRDFFRSDQRGFGGNNYLVTRCAPGTLRAGGVSYAMPGQLTQANAGSLVAGTTNTCNDLIGQDLFPSQRYNSVNGTFTQEITPWLTVFADGFYSKREYERLPAYFSSTLTVPQTNAFFVRPAGFVGTSYTIDYNFINDLPRDVSIGSATNWQVTPGVRVKLPHDWQFEALVTYGEGNDQSDQVRGLNATALNAALASSNPATAFDPYGLGRTSPATLLAISNFVTLSPTLNEFVGYEARINGALFSLPGGDVKLAAGYEGQEINTHLGSARGAAGTPITFRHFQRRVDSGYAELLIPIFSGLNATPGFQKLEINLAVRYDKYSDVGDTTNPKFGVNWSPLKGLTLRGSYGTSFRAPLISQIYGNSNNLFGQTYQNPAGGSPLTGFAYSGPNLNLAPEEATTWSIGGDWDVTPNLRVSATYWNVEYINQVDSYLSDLAILTRESQFAGTGIILTGTAARDRVLALLASGVTLARGTFPGGDPNNVTLFIDGRNNNLGQSNTSGIDATVNWRIPTDNLGTFTLNASGTYLTNFKTAVSPAGTPVDRRNTLFYPLTFKARGSIAWDIDAMHAQVTVTHVGGYRNTAVTPNQNVSSFTPVDLILAFDLGEMGAPRALEGITLGIEVRNMFDSGPPYVNLAPGVNGGGGYDPSAASPIGRVMAASIRAKF